MSGKDFSKELEDVPDVSTNPLTDTKIEQVISVNQQIANVLREKNMTNEEKVYQLLSKTLNPFESVGNFKPGHLNDTTSDEMQKFKHPNVPDPRVPKSLQRMMFQGSDFLPQHQERIDAIIDE